MPETTNRTPHAHAGPAFTPDDIDAVLSLAAVPFSADARERLLEIATGHGIAVLCRVIKAAENAHLIAVESIDAEELGRISWAICGG